MKNKKINWLLVLIAFGVSANAHAYFFELLDSHEMYDSKIVISRANTGFVSGKICKECKTQTFKVTQDTRAFNVKGNQVELHKANQWSGKGVIYKYDKKTFELVKITEEGGNSND